MMMTQGGELCRRLIDHRGPSEDILSGHGSACERLVKQSRHSEKFKRHVLTKTAASVLDNA